jgi:hypothetical protein
MEFGRWIKSSWSGANGDCVEVRLEGDASTTVAVRDSKNPDQGAHAFTPEAWIGFIEGVKAGQFDLA